MTKLNCYEKENIVENSRKFGDFSIITEPIDLEGNVINPVEKSRIINEVPGLKIISWNLYPPADEY